MEIGLIAWVVGVCCLYSIFHGFGLDWLHFFGTYAFRMGLFLRWLSRVVSRVVHILIE